MYISQHQKKIFFEERAVTGIIHFRYFKNKTPVFEFLY